MMKYALLASILALAPSMAQAQYTYRCVGNDGKKYYGSTIPQQCLGRPVEQLSPQGVMVRRIDPESDEKARIAKEVEAVKKREEDALAKEASRRNRALLATYTSEKDIDDARGRALTENEKAIKEVEQRIGDIKKRQAGYDKEMEFYREGDRKAKPGASATQAKGESKAPPRLMQDIKNAEVELSAQENLLAIKKKEVETINAKYAEDKRRYRDLTGQDAASRGRALGMEKGVTVTSKPGSRIDEARNERDAQQRAREERQELDNIERQRQRGQTVRRLERR